MEKSEMYLSSMKNTIYFFLIPRYNNIEDKKRGTYYDKTRSIQRN